MNLSVILSIVSQIIGAIHFAEQFFPAKGAGSEKKASVLDKAQEIIDGAPIVVEEAKQLKEKVSPLVDDLVAVMNKHGWLGAQTVENVRRVEDGVTKTLDTLGGALGSASVGDAGKPSAV